MRQFKREDPSLDEFALVGQSVLLELVEVVPVGMDLVYYDFLYVDGPDILKEHGAIKGESFVILQKDLSEIKALKEEHMRPMRFRDAGKREFIMLSSYTFIQAFANAPHKPVPEKDRLKPPQPTVREKKEGFEDKLIVT